MIRISSLLAAGAVQADISCNGKPAIMAKIALLAAENYGLDVQSVLEGLEEREHLGTTGFGGGTAIPHTKLPDLDRPAAICLRLAKPVDYDAVDGDPVDLIIALISPSHDGASHLRALAEVSRLLRDEKFAAQLRGAADSDALFALLNTAQERDAA
jgi:nitrogen PTS system EIIA component